MCFTVSLLVALYLDVPLKTSHTRKWQRHESMCTISS